MDPNASISTDMVPSVSPDNIPQGFLLFPLLPPEVQIEIWRSCARHYPARIVEIKEYLQPKPLSIRDITGNEIVSFKSQAPAPTILYVCHDSRTAAQEFYEKIFGTAEMPAQTWFDFNKDMLYLQFGFCCTALEGYRRCNDGRQMFDAQKRWKPPHGYFFNELKRDIEKVQDLAFNGCFRTPWKGPFDRDMWAGIIATRFINVERVTLIHAQYPTAWKHGEIVFAHESPYQNAEERDFHSQLPQQERLHENVLTLRQQMFRDCYSKHGDYWFGRKPYPWFEAGTFVERGTLLDNGGPSGPRPRREGCRLATDEDRQFAFPDYGMQARRNGVEHYSSAFFPVD